jgi:hypothetical protein
MLDLKGMLMLFIRCELAARVYAAIRDLTRVDFASSHFSNKKKDGIKPEMSI